MSTTRRLPVHDFVQEPTRPTYPWCVYPDPGNAVSGVCGMSQQWHVRDAEERAAEEPPTPFRMKVFVGIPATPGREANPKATVSFLHQAAPPTPPDRRELSNYGSPWEYVEIETAGGMIRVYPDGTVTR